MDSVLGSHPTDCPNLVAFHEKQGLLRTYSNTDPHGDPTAYWKVLKVHCISRGGNQFRLINAPWVKFGQKT